MIELIKNEFSECHTAYLQDTITGVLMPRVSLKRNQAWKQCFMVPNNSAYTDGHVQR